MMKNWVSLSAVGRFLMTVGILLAFFIPDASAKDMSRRFGVGVDSPISQYADDGHGVSIVYSINKYFSMQLIFGVATYHADVENPNDSSKTVEANITDWNVSIRGLIPIVMSADVNLEGVVGFTASGRASDGFKASKEEYQKYNDGYNFSIDLGLRPEWFVTEHFSLHTQVGIGINIITRDGTKMNPGLSDSTGTAFTNTKAKGVQVDFFKNVDVLGMAGFTFWF